MGESIKSFLEKADWITVGVVGFMTACMMYSISKEDIKYSVFATLLGMLYIVSQSIIVRNNQKMADMFIRRQEEVVMDLQMRLRMELGRERAANANAPTLEKASKEITK